MEQKIELVSKNRKKEKRMKKLITISIIIVLAIMFMMNCVYAVDTVELEFKTINNKKNERFDLYLLLPREYINFAIQEANLPIYYDGANTLKRNDIPGITVQKSNVQDEIYTEKGTEYVQIRLVEENGVYSFELLENYPQMDIKYRIKNIEKDYIVHIDNFKIEKGKCQIEYDYTKDTVKQPDQKVMNFNIKLLLIVLLLIIIIGAIAYKKGRN